MTKATGHPLPRRTLVCIAKIVIWSLLSVGGILAIPWLDEHGFSVFIVVIGGPIVVALPIYWIVQGMRHAGAARGA